MSVSTQSTDSRTQTAREELYRSLLEKIDSMTMVQMSTIMERLRNGTEGAGFKKRPFKILLSEVLGVSKERSGIEILFNKIVTNSVGNLDGSPSGITLTAGMFLNFMLHRLMEQETNGKISFIPFQDQPNFKHNFYSKHSPCKMLPSESLPFVYTVSKDGVITTWSQAPLSVQKGTVVDDKASAISRAELSRLKRSNLWITDSVLMTAINMLVVSTTSRELNFYDVSSPNYKCQARLCDLPRVPLCMTSYTKPSGATYVMYGDGSGSVIVLLFHTPLVSLFRPSDNKDVVSALDDLQMVLYSRLPDHAQFVSITKIDRIHPDWVRKVMYVPHNNSIISCCSSREESLVYRHIANKRKPYIFNLSKGIACFDFSYELNLLVTGSCDHVIRFWDPFVTIKPMAILNLHRTPVVDVLIHNTMGVVFSLSTDASLCVWGAKDHTLLQMTTVKFPFSQRQLDYGHNPLFLLTPSLLTVACNEYIAEYKLGVASSSSEGGWETVSHPKPLTAAVYDSMHDQVISGCEGGELLVWELATGAKVQRFKDIHGNKEITSVIVDSSVENKRVLTGSSNGEIKVWNHITGECLKTMNTAGNLEITGIVHYAERKKFLAAGWNKRITSFPDTNDIHDDITTMVFCKPKYLATGTFDGHIIVWEIDTEKIAVMLRSSLKKRSPIHHHSNVASSFSQRRRSSVLSTTSCISSMSGHSSNSSGKRLSMYLLKENVADCDYLPVDKLLFLGNRMKLELQLSHTALLVSSEGGYAKFWSFPPNKVEIKGSFCLTSDGTERNVLALSTDANDQFLVAGDIRGNITIFDIGQYCIGFNSSTPPQCLVAWQAHAAEILSVCYISHHTQPLVLSASADRTVRLWNTSGHYIGTFGQKVEWDLSDPVTFQYPKTPWGEMRTNVVGHLADNKGERPLVHDDGNVGGVTTTSTVKARDGFNKGEKEQTADAATNIVSGQLGGSGTSSLVSSASSLPPIIDNSLYHQYSENVNKRMKSKASRRQDFSGIDIKQTERFGMQCSPYQALQILTIQDTPIPNSIKDILKS